MIKLVSVLKFTFSQVFYIGVYLWPDLLRVQKPKIAQAEGGETRGEKQLPWLGVMLFFLLCISIKISNLEIISRPQK